MKCMISKLWLGLLMFMVIALGTSCAVNSEFNLSGLWNDPTAKSQIILLQEGNGVTAMEAYRSGGVTRTWIGKGTISGSILQLKIHFSAESNGGKARDMNITVQIRDNDYIILNKDQHWERVW